ncbi:MAG: DUF2029 domain-containing protein [Flavobacteriia bacterium]|nr:DUF2029 domain-containing protein [Flavobacteriia bacterium]
MKAKRKVINLFAMLLILFGFFQLAHTSREDTLSLVLWSGFLFGALWFWIRNYNQLGLLFLLSILCRLFFFSELPLLSQDFYRFLWDGALQGMGINPYLYTPFEIKDLVVFPELETLYKGMGTLSNGNYSNYPPLSQYLYQGAAYLLTETLLPPVTFLRTLFLIADVLFFFVGVHLLKKLTLEPHYIAWYFLNPLVVVEGIGNLHAESFMLCFACIGWLLILNRKTVLSGFFTAIAIGIKLLPLLFIPLFFDYLGLRKFLVFCISCFLFSVLFWFPFWDESMATNYLNTLSLWFTTFEFNGSVYNLIRAIGYEIKGYNIIRSVGQVTPFIVLFMVLGLSFLRSNRSPNELFKGLLFLLSGYFFIATTVHPWYLLFLVFLGVVTQFVYPLVWSAVVFWSYLYYNASFESFTLFWHWGAYLLVYGCFIWEISKGPLGEHIQKPHFLRS